MTYRSALLLFLGVFVLQFSRILFFGEVIFPHDNGLEVGSSEKETDTRITNRKFSDESSAFIPELANNLRSDRKGWLPTWNAHVQLGRAAYQTSGLSRAYLLTNALSYLTSDPFQLYTALVLLTIGLTGGFFLLFLRSLGLHPVAALCATIGLTFTTPTSYWLTFVMFLSAICWSSCLLWLITEFTKKPSWLLALGLTFATYSLLMTSYPQLTILGIYITGTYAVVRIAQMTDGPRNKIKVALSLLGCGVAGTLASLPVYLDLLPLARNSLRFNQVADSFFLGVLPSFHRFSDIANFVLTIFDWSWLGNAIDPKFPLTFNGLSFTPIFATLLWLSLFIKQRRAVLFWQLALALCLIGTIWPAAYLFAVHHLGFGLSRIQILVGGIIPGFVLSAVVLDGVLRSKLGITARTAIWLLLPVAAAIVIVFLNWPWSSVHRMAMVTTLLLLIALLGAIHFRSTVTFIVLTFASVLLYGQPLILSQPPKTIHVSSRLIDAIGAATPNGSRYAIVDTAIKAELPPNEEALVSLNSVNSYDSLSSRRYQELTIRWRMRPDRTLGRLVKFLDAKLALGDSAFPFSNVDALLSRRPLQLKGLTLIGDVAGIKLYRPTTSPVYLQQTSRFELRDSNHSIMDMSPAFPDLNARRVESLNDFQRIRVTPSSKETLLFLSQQYHPAWRASSNSRLLRVVDVNGFYQGVILPPFTNEVELWFRPFVIWSWIPQLFFVGAAGALLLRRYRRAPHFPDEVPAV